MKRLTEEESQKLDDIAKSLLSLSQEVMKRRDDSGNPLESGDYAKISSMQFLRP